MVKDVLLSVQGLQMSPEDGSDTIELITSGEYYYRNDKHYLLYEEVTEGFAKPTKNVIKAAPNYMELTKKGVVNVHMVFEKNQKNITYYYTPYRSLQIGIDATRVDVFETEDSILIDVEYGLEINCEFIANCHIKIHAKPKGSHMQFDSNP